MDYVRLGRTGLSASVMGMGCGGPSRLGQSGGGTTAESVAVVRRAIELGVNFIDTAEGYGTEPAVGEAIAGRRRDQVILSTKKSPTESDGPLSAAGLRAGLEASLQRLGVDCVDIYHLHGVQPAMYSHCVDELVPEMLRLRDQGKLRFLGITEQFGGDPGHDMLVRALEDGCWDVMMVGFNMLNQSARERVFVETMAQDIGVLVMFALRRALSRPERLREVMAGLVADGLVDAGAMDDGCPLSFLTESGVAESIQDAGYRFCRYETGCHVILSGTGRVAHLEANARSLLAPPLPDAVVQRVRNMFAKVDTIAGN